MSTYVFCRAGLFLLLSMFCVLRFCGAVTSTCVDVASWFGFGER